MRKPILPALTLFLLSPIIGELVSGSSPPLNWLNPMTYLFVVTLYGSGALLVRELAIRWRAGWAGVLLLGAAYGIVEEGLDVMSFFNPQWSDLGATAFYGRWAGVNWVWAVHLTGFHDVFSIAIPILLVSLIFPPSRREPWLGCSGFALVGLMLLASVTLGNVLFRTAYHYSPPAIQYLASILLAGLLVLVAKRVAPSRDILDPTVDSPLPPPVVYWLAGFFLTVAFFLTAWVLPNTAVPPLAAIWIFLLLAVGTAVLLARSYRHGAFFDDGRKLALAFGGLMFFVLLSPILELKGTEATTGESPAGMVCVGGMVFLSLVLLSISVWRRGRRAAAMAKPVPSADL